MAGRRVGGRGTTEQPVTERLDLLKPDAIGIAQATVIGMATSAPAATVVHMQHSYAYAAHVAILADEISG